jgi:uncharacterized protein (UPF0216 family)
MTERPHVSEETVMTRWLAHELKRMNEGTVAARKTLGELLGEPVPATVTRGGQEYRFDRRVLETIAAAVDSHTKRHLKLPVLFFCDTAVTDSCFIDDETAFLALRQLGELSEM